MQVKFLVNKYNLNIQVYQYELVYLKINGLQILEYSKLFLYYYRNEIHCTIPNYISGMSGITFNFKIKMLEGKKSTHANGN